MVGKLELDNFDKTKRLTEYKDIVVLMRNTRNFIAFKRFFLNTAFQVILFYLKDFYNQMK